MRYPPSMAYEWIAEGDQLIHEAEAVEEEIRDERSKKWSKSEREAKEGWLKEPDKFWDALHQRGDGPYIGKQIILADASRGYCLHLFDDGTCLKCPPYPEEFSYHEVLKLVGSEDALPPGARPWLEQAKAYLAYYTLELEVENPVPRRVM
jgi:hypothetical protein